MNDVGLTVDGLHTHTDDSDDDAYDVISEPHTERSFSCQSMDCADRSLFASSITQCGECMNRPSPVALGKYARRQLLTRACGGGGGNIHPCRRGCRTYAWQVALWHEIEQHIYVYGAAMPRERSGTYPRPPSARTKLEGRCGMQMIMN